MTTREKFRPMVQAASLIIALGAAALVVSALSIPARAATGAEGAAEIRGVVKDLDGIPLEGVEVEMTPIGAAGKPYVTKTRKDGTFVFPFLPYNKERYEVAFRKEGFLLRKIHIISRQPQTSADRGEGQIFQDDEGTLGPGKKPPAVFAKPGGHVKIEAGLATQKYFDAMAEALAAAQAGGTPAPAAGAPKAATAQMSSQDQAQLLASQGKYPEAIAAMEQSIQEEATADKWLNLGRIKMRSEDTDGAKAAYARAAGLDPSMRGVHFLLGKLLNDEGRTPEAIAEMEKELALDPSDASTLKALGALYHNADRKADAIAVFEKVVAVAPDVDTLAQLAALYGEQGNFTRSEELYRKILEANPGHADEVYLRIGRSIMNQSNIGTEDRKRASDAFDRAIQSNPSNAKAHLELAYVLLGLGDIPGAKIHMKRYLELQPNGSDAGEVRAQLKDLS